MEFRRVLFRLFFKPFRTRLGAGGLEEWWYGGTLRGKPPGGGAPPTLPNIFLAPPHTIFATTLLPPANPGTKRQGNKEWERLNNKINHHRSTVTAEEYLGLVRERRKHPSRDPHDPSFRRLYYVRYADDCAPRRCERTTSGVSLSAMLRER